ncbi:enoyl-CoA hydratase/isomerase family protein [Phyllobacterium sp. 0TCS1.6C]|uniref:enoyl-CoA hydratase/isomerase family protein n=1 Tax=unclassified Phyllobacterium TaxID=2638441 RepID=UPI00226561E3|nr:MULTISPECIES: enoyl-CoA hydratase/isomerase family protein [unclassified Phyllobacterium]MCX8279057.1 enoyl-CoA hydratase/isomerase family protein [Phyllobacterium sp. 0TCS1.6C]MCX8293841.1 enoyl-CoA hydratase/isomerase family protein [Phyllobacterium sp. 0TCS1.6A]
MAECVDLIFDGDIAEIWLNRPKVLNALSRQLMNELDAALAEVGRSSARALLLMGRGERAFCAGADITEFKPVATTVEARVWHYRRDVCMRIQTLPMPTIAAMHGYTFGGGIALALPCDLRIAAADTLFALPETALGTFPGMGVTLRLPQIVGRSEAMRLIFTGERIDAAEALSIGLVNEVVLTSDLIARAREVAGYIVERGPLGVRYAKEAIARGERTALAEGLKVEIDLNMFMDTTEDYVEGAKAFGERRKPVFRGR